jgi:hypothetical protein
MAERRTGLWRSRLIFDEAPAPAAAAPAEFVIAPFLVRFECKDGLFERDLSDQPRPAIVRVLVRVLNDYGAGRLARASARQYVQAIRAFAAYLAAHEEANEVRELDGELFDRFEGHLRRKRPRGGTAYSKLSPIAVLLRHLDVLDPSQVAATLRERLSYTGTESPNYEPISGYAEALASQIEAACRQQVGKVLRRLTVDGPRMIEQGRDPREHGWDRLENIVWYIAHHGPIVLGDFQAIAGFGSRSAATHWLSRRRLSMDAAHAYVFPTLDDLYPFAVLLAFRTGIEPDCLRRLPVDCLTNEQDGRATLSYFKPRARKRITFSVRVRGSGTAGGLLRLVQRITRRLRVHVPEEHQNRLWLMWTHSRLGTNPVNARLPDAYTVVKENRFTNEAGEPVTINLQRARKTYWERRDRATGGAIRDVARGRKTPQTLAAHYFSTENLRATREDTIVAGQARALAVVSRSTIVAEEPSASKRSLPVLSSSFIAKCKDPYNAPFGRPGELCQDPFMGCLDCENAYITSLHLPAILGLLNRMIQRRDELSAAEWAYRYGGGYTNIMRDILPLFNERQLMEARAVAEAEKDLLWLPPEFYSHEL